MKKIRGDVILPVVATIDGEDFGSPMIRERGTSWYSGRGTSWHSGNGCGNAGYTDWVYGSNYYSVHMNGGGFGHGQGHMGPQGIYEADGWMDHGESPCGNPLTK